MIVSVALFRATPLKGTHEGKKKEEKASAELLDRRDRGRPSEQGQEDAKWKQEAAAAAGAGEWVGAIAELARPYAPLPTESKSKVGSRRS